MKKLFKNHQNQRPLWKSLSTGTRTTLITFSTVAALVLPTGIAMAKEPVLAHHERSANSGHQSHQKHQPVHAISRGIVMQVDTSNSNNINFTLMDHQGNTQTIYLTANTRFANKQSAAELVVNALVTVKTLTDSSGQLDAQEIILQKQNAASFDLQGIVASTYVSQKQLNLALKDGTVLSIIVKNPALASLQKGTSITLKTHLNTARALEAANFSISRAQSKKFTVQGGVSSQNSRMHRFILTSPSGASFSVNMSPSTILQLGENVVVSGNIDGKGDFIEQSIVVESANQSPIEIEGMVSAVDSTANTFSLVDEEGNSSLFSADPTLLTNLTVGNVYTVTASVTANESLQATSVSASQGDNREKKIELQGSIQTYDQTSGLLTLAGADNQSFSIQVNSQTALEGDSSSSVTLTAGENVDVIVQLNADGSYSALHIEIQGSDSN